MLFESGTILLNKYRLEEFIGQGAFGQVYRATHLGLHTPRALKVLRRDAPGLGSTEYKDFRDRFELEARLGASLDQPNLIRVYDYEQDGETLILVMEYAAGGNLASRLDKARQAGKPFSILETVQLGLDVAQGLAALHELDAVHRDLKPSNILFDAYGRAKVADLGLAQIPGGPSMRSRLSDASPHPGTPGYMSPEQETSSNYLKPSSDIYALGLILFECLTLRNFSNQPPGTHVKVLHQDVPVWLDEILTKMLADEYKLRPWNGAKAAELLESGLAQEKKQEEDEAAHHAAERAAQEAAAANARQEAAEQAQREAERLKKEQAAQAAAEARARRKAEQAALLAAEKERQQAARAAWLKKYGAGIGLGFGLVLVLGLLGIGFAAWILSGGPTRASGTGTAAAAATQAQATALAVVWTTTPSLSSEVTAAPIVSRTPENSPSQTVLPVDTPVLGIGSTRVREADGMVEVYVPAGEFSMGSNDGDTDEQPIHTVYLDSYWIDQTEVTNKQYKICEKIGLCTPASKASSYTRYNYYGNATYNDYPAIFVNWNQAQIYCEWIGGRLPTEAEWEKAAGGTDKRIYPWGNESPVCSLAIFSGCSGDTRKIGSCPKGMSPYGAMDMGGNVWEWVMDWFGVNYYSLSPSDNPTGPETGEARVLRGGSWNLTDHALRTANRVAFNPSESSFNLGFRCTRSP